MPIVFPGHPPLAHAEGTDGLSLMVTHYPLAKRGRASPGHYSSDVRRTRSTHKFRRRTPFRIRGFHADNGSEYINHKVATLLDKLRVEFTKSRPRHSNDNGLAETKNGAVIRKQLGYEHIPQCFASAVNAFCAEHLNPYLNFHRPCLFAEELTDNKGKIRKRYPQRLVMTPFEKLAALEQVESHLRPGITLDTLRRQAASISDNDAAARLNEARNKLFLSIHKRSRNTP